MKPALRLKDHWPSILFAASLLVISSVLVIVYMNDAQKAWCDDKEVLAVCLRNWANAVGNVITAIIAALAAWFAYGQLKAASRQADLPRLEQRLELALKLESAVKEALLDTHSAIQFFDEITHDDTVRAYYIAFNMEFDLFTHLYKSIMNQKDKIYEIDHVKLTDSSLKLLLTRLRSVLSDLVINCGFFHSLFNQYSKFYTEASELMYQLDLQAIPETRKGLNKIVPRLEEILEDATKMVGQYSSEIKHIIT